jgi:hypothetical protein
MTEYGGVFAGAEGGIKILLLGLQLREPENYDQERSSRYTTIQNQDNKTSHLSYRPIENRIVYKFRESQQK